MIIFHQAMSTVTATDLDSMSIFDLSNEQLRERLRPEAEAVIREKFAKGGYITYYDPSFCPTSSHMVHEYSDRKELIWMDDNYQEHFVKIL
jgi:hypothetical protein